MGLTLLIKLRKFLVRKGKKKAKVEESIACTVALDDTELPFVFGANGRTEKYFPAVKQFSYVDKNHGTFARNHIKDGYLYTNQGTHWTWLRKTFVFFKAKALIETPLALSKGDQLVIINPDTSEELVLEIIQAK